MEFLKVPRKKLLLIAGVVWLIAGANILLLGVGAFSPTIQDWMFWLIALGTLGIFVYFHIWIFSRMVGKHHDRIEQELDERTYVWNFFDKRSYIIMALMMIMGLGLRTSGIVPDPFIVFFYTGLGAALMVGGLSFTLRYFRGTRSSCPR